MHSYRRYAVVKNQSQPGPCQAAGVAAERTLPIAAHRVDHAALFSPCHPLLTLARLVCAPTAMPMVEVLSNSAASGAYWTYTTAPPAHAVGTAPTLASTGRGGRTTRQAQHTHSIENSAARQRQVASRLLDLERDNYRDVAIPIPKKDQFHGHQRGESSLPPSTVPFPPVIVWLLGYTVD